MSNNKGRWFLSIFLSSLCLTFIFFLLNTTPLIFAELPPLDSGLAFNPYQGAYAPPGGGYFPQVGPPFGIPYQNPGLGFTPPAAPFGSPYQNPGLGFAPPAAPFGSPYQNPGLGFAPPAAPFGSPYQNPGLGFAPPAAPFGSPYQNPGLGMMPPTGFMPPGTPYGIPQSPGLPNLPPSYNTSASNTNFPVYDTIYNPGAVPNQGFSGPVLNMYNPPPVPQPFPGVSPYAPSGTAQGLINPVAGYGNPLANPYAVPYGNMAQLPGAFPQQGYGSGAFPGINPFQQLNPLQQPWSPYGPNINPYNPFNPYTPYNPYKPNVPPGYDPSTYYPETGGNGDGGGDGGGDTVTDIQSAKGHWAGTWEAWLTDPNEGVVNDPNGQIVVTMSGEISFHVTEQPSSGGAIQGTTKITHWNVDTPPQDWPGDWTGESDEVVLTGWIDKYSRYFQARYYYYPGKEAFGDYDANEDYENIKGMYTWMFDSNKLTITETGISGQFNITGTGGYYVIGVFRAGKYVPN